MKPDPDYSLYLVTDRDILGKRDLAESVEQAVRGGVTIVQLREKAAGSVEFYNLARQVQAVTSQYNVPLLINDRLDIALAVDAAGLHVGQQDLPASLARKLLGPDKILGVSVATLQEALLAAEAGADYLGVGAVFPTTSKDDVRETSLELLASIKNRVKIPVVAIGGINEHNIGLLQHARVDGVAVISAIFGKEDIAQAARELKKLFLSL